WHGTVAADSANVRRAPRASAPLVAELPRGAAVAVQRWVAGDAVLADQPGWAQLGDEAYVYGPLLRRDPLDSAPPLPADVAPRDGRWIYVSLTLQEATAYEGAQPVRWVAISSGRPGWETRPGSYRVLRRVPREDMASGRLLDQAAGHASYQVKDVHWVQYFLE